MGQLEGQGRASERSNLCTQSELDRGGELGLGYLVVDVATTTKRRPKGLGGAVGSGQFL